MTEGTDALYDKALELSANVPDNFLELGRALSRLYDRDPNLFRQLAAKSNMGLRKAYSLIEVSRTFEPLAIPRDQLRKIGWSKLQLIAKHVTPNTLEALLQLAATRRRRTSNAICAGEARRQRPFCAEILQSEVIRATRRSPRV